MEPLGADLACVCHASRAPVGARTQNVQTVSNSASPIQVQPLAEFGSMGTRSGPGTALIASFGVALATSATPMAAGKLSVRFRHVRWSGRRGGRRFPPRHNVIVPSTGLLSFPDLALQFW